MNPRIPIKKSTKVKLIILFFISNYSLFLSIVLQNLIHIKSIKYNKQIYTIIINVIKRLKDNNTLIVAIQMENDEEQKK